jgi:hypothetical protein
MLQTLENILYKFNGIFTRPTETVTRPSVDADRRLPGERAMMIRVQSQPYRRCDNGLEPMARMPKRLDMSQPPFDASESANCGSGGLIRALPPRLSSRGQTRHHHGVFGLARDDGRRRVHAAAAMRRLCCGGYARWLCAVAMLRRRLCGCGGGYATCTAARRLCCGYQPAGLGLAVHARTSR